MARTIQIGKRRWLAGMTWSSFEDAPNKEELQEDAQRLGSSWASVRISESAIQAGFCAPIDNAQHPSKLFSLAAMLADSREQPWLGIFKIEDGVWWYIAVRDGHAILPDGDVIGGEAEIHAARDRHSGYTDWKYIEGDLALLEELIDDIEAKPTPVRSLASGGLPSVSLIVAAVLLLSAVSGGYWWWSHKQQLLENERQVAMARMRAEMMAGKVAVPVSSPLLTTPPPNEWLAACSNAVMDLPMSHDGWSLQDVSCIKTVATIHWVRKDGATVANKPGGSLSVVGDTVDQVIPLVGLPAHGSNNAIDLAAAKLVLRAWAQAAAFDLTMKDAGPVPVLPGAAPGANQNTAGVQAGPPSTSFALETPISPFGMDMSSIPGLRIVGLKSTIKGWQIEGQLYGR